MCLVVIVDDRATNRAIYTQLARSIGQDVEVRSFGDPEEALKWLTAHRVDLIVTDYDMPRIVGDEFISRFRRLPHSGGVPIMMVTICDRRQLRLRALESGATDFLQAPIDHFEFLTRARNLLKLSRGAAPAEPAPAKAAPEQDGGFDHATRGLLERCAPGGYAFHFIEVAATGEAPDLIPALQRHLRGGDLAIRIDPLRYVLLQNHVAGLADAKSLARRLIRARASFKGVASLRMGAAVPREQDASRKGSNAEQCLREARETAREVWRVGGDALSQDRLRLAPVVDLRTGALTGAQLLNGGSPAEAADPLALGATLARAADMRLSAGEAFRVALRFALGDEAEGFPPRLPPLLADAGAKPTQLDLILCARDIASDEARASRVIAALKALGVGLTLDLGSLAPEDRRPAALSLALSDALAQDWCDAIRFPCQDQDAVELARSLRASADRLSPRAPALVADGVPSANLLSALRRAGASRAQGSCFGAPFALRDLGALLAARLGARLDEIEARRA